MGFVLRNAQVRASENPIDIAVANGRIAAMKPNLRSDAPSREAGGRLVFPGFVDGHIHLDKTCILKRCAFGEGTLAEAVRQTARAKAMFTEDDIYECATHVVEKAILHGTTVLAPLSRSTRGRACARSP